jgi:hypothetical protein
MNQLIAGTKLGNYQVIGLLGKGNVFPRCECEGIEMERAQIFWKPLRLLFRSVQCDSKVGQICLTSFIACRPVSQIEEDRCIRVFEKLS